MSHYCEKLPETFIHAVDFLMEKKKKKKFKKFEPNEHRKIVTITVIFYGCLF